MCYLTKLRFRTLRATALVAVALVATLAFPPLTREVGAASWRGIEPLKSRRADVERALGRPFREQPGQGGALQFKVAGGTATVAFVSARFVESKNILPELEGTVLQIILEHDNATETPESLGIARDGDFEREEQGRGISVYRNNKDGVFYTFINGKLRRTRYSPSAEQLARASRKSALRTIREE